MKFSRAIKGIMIGILVSFIFLSQKLEASPVLGLFLSPVTKTENGFLILGLMVTKTPSGLAFTAQELRYHASNGWEEILYLGGVKGSERGWEFSPDSCQVRAHTSFGEKKGLLRRFDCEHLKPELTYENGQYLLSSSLAGTFKNIAFAHFIPGIGEEPVAISFLLPDRLGEEGIWGFHLNGIGNRNPVKIWNRSQKRWEPFRQFVKPDLPSDYEVYRWKRSFSD